MIEVGALVDVAGGIAAIGVALSASALSAARGFRHCRPLIVVAGTAAAYFALDLHTAIPGIPGFWRASLNGFDIVALALHVAGWAMLRAQPTSPPLGRPTRVALAAIGLVALLAAVPTLAFAPAEVVRRSSAGLVYHDVDPTAAGSALFVVIVLGMAFALARHLRDAIKGVGSYYYVAALGLILFACIHDMLVNLGALPTPFIGGLFFFAATVCVAIEIARQFVRTANRLDALTVDLEARAEERTRALESAREALRKTERLATIGQLAAGVAHEINNPIAAVIGNLSVVQELVADASVDAEVRACIDDSIVGANRVARIVRQLQQAGAGARADQVRERVAVNECIRAAMAAACAAEPTRATVTIEAPSDVFVLGDTTMLEQVLTHLVSNALQALPERGQGGHVDVRVEEEAPSQEHPHGRISISVVDDGIGMSAATLRRVFEPFFTTKPVGAGTGLGLAVSSGLVDTMQGELRVESTEGAGSTFVVVLDRGTLPSDAPSDDVMVAAQRRLRVLVVDDDEVVLAMLQRTLRSHYDLELADSIETAIASVAAGSFDAIICDMTIAGGGGPRLARELRAIDSPLVERTIFITGGARTDADQDFIAKMGDRVLMKPCSTTDIVSAIARVRPADDEKPAITH